MLPTTKVPKSCLVDARLKADSQYYDANAAVDTYERQAQGGLM